MSSEYDPQFESLQLEICSPKLIVKTMIKNEVNIDLTLRMFVGHENLFLASSQPTIFRITVWDSIWYA